jgi:hypothetical protein
MFFSLHVDVQKNRKKSIIKNVDKSFENEKFYTMALLF